MQKRDLNRSDSLSQLARGIGIALGTGLFCYEVAFDQFAHPVALPIAATLIGAQFAVEPLWKRILWLLVTWLARQKRIRLSLGPLVFESAAETETQSPEKPTAIRVNTDALPQAIAEKIVATIPEPKTPNVDTAGTAP